VRVKLKKEVTFYKCQNTELLCYIKCRFHFTYGFRRLSLLGCLRYHLWKGLENISAQRNGIL
jgi:hypothetical protein